MKKSLMKKLILVGYLVSFSSVLGMQNRDERWGEWRPRSLVTTKTMDRQKEEVKRLIKGYHDKVVDAILGMLFE